MAAAHPGLRSTRTTPKNYGTKSRLGEHAHHFFQAICRVAVRRSVGTSCGTARCWIIGAQKDGFSRENLERTFPGATIKVYSRPNFVKRMQLKGRPREAFEIIKARLNGTNEVRITDVESAIGYSPANFRLNIRRDEAFLAACAVQGIEEGSSETLTGANGKAALVFRRRSKPTEVAVDHDAVRNHPSFTAVLPPTTPVESLPPGQLRKALKLILKTLTMEPEVALTTIPTKMAMDPKNYRQRVASDLGSSRHWS